MERLSRQRTTLLLAAALLTAVWLVFGRTLSHDFVLYDDDAYVTANPHVRGGVSLAGIAWSFASRRLANWHPLTWLSHMVDCQLFGMVPAGHHATSVLLHGISSVLLFAWLRQLTGFTLRAWLVAAVFAVHPLRAESVAWVAERKDVLSVLLGLAACASYTAYAQRLSRWGYWRTVGWTAAALAAKPTMVTLPGVFLLLDFWPLARWPAGEASWRRLRELVAEKWAPAMLALGVAWLTYDSQRAEGAVSGPDVVPWAYRWQTAAVASVSYLGDFFWPRELSFIYPQMLRPWPVWQWLGAVLLLAGVTATVCWQWRARGYLAMGWCWYLGCLVPMSGVVAFGAQWKADRYTYWPQVGLAWGVVWLLAELTGRWSARLRRGLATAVLVSLSVACGWQVGVWRNTLTLTEHALAVQPENYIAWAVRGYALETAGNSEEARRCYESALAIRPGHAEAQALLAMAQVRAGDLPSAEEHARLAIQLKPGLAAAQNALGVALLEQGRQQESLKYLREAARLVPDFARYDADLAVAHLRLGELDEARRWADESLRLAPEDPHGLAIRALVSLHRGELEEAERLAAEAVHRGQELALAWETAGLVSRKRGEARRAAERLKRAVELDPQRSQTWWELGQQHEALGQTAEAEAAYRRALRWRPRFPEAANNLAWLLATTRASDQEAAREAVVLASQAVEWSGMRSAELLDTWAVACAACGQWDDARQLADEALAVAQREGKQGLAAELRQRLEEYSRASNAKEGR